MKRARPIVFVLAFVISPAVARAQDDELARARFLDQQGVRAFGENRFRDAMALFSASYRAGGPPTELWNVARCQLKLDNPEDARRTLEEYLDRKDLSDGDRAEGKRLLDEIERKQSTFVVASSPSNVVVTVDGHAIGVTPLASTLSPGAHEIKIGQTTKHVDARDGRAIVLSIDLETGGERPTPEKHPQHHARRFSFEAGLLGMVSSLAGAAVVEGGVAPEISAGFRAFSFGKFGGEAKVHLGFGIRVQLGFDQWSTSAGVSNVPPTSCTVPNDFSAVETLLMPTVFGSWRLSRFVSVGARLGFGASIYASGAPIAGDLFAPSCIYGNSLVPDGYAAVDVSLHMTDALRLVFFPATLDVHPAYAGARSDSSIDATAPWARIGTGVAVAVDL